MKDKALTNIAFVILMLFLLVSALKHKTVGFDSFGEFDEIFNLGNLEQETEKESEAVVNEFEHMKDIKRKESLIDINTARTYLKELPISGTEMLALTKIKKISPYLNTNKKIVIYVTNQNGSDVEAFLKEFAKTRNHFAKSSEVVFLPRESVWNMTKENIKNSHDRAVYNLQKDCGLFCVIIPNQEKLIRLKGENVNKKTAQIMHVYLTH